MVDAEFIAAMPDRALLVNVSRGKLIDTAALVVALAAGKLSGVALDVLAGEPPGGGLAADPPPNPRFETRASIETLASKPTHERAHDHDERISPGTGTSEAGGLTSRELLRLLRCLADPQIVGADVVEVAPAYDHAQITAVAASHVVYELVCAMAGR